MKEYAIEGTANFDTGELDFAAEEWCPSTDIAAVTIKRLIEKHPKATSFVFNVVQRDHTP
jgi:hypothetical protein